MVLLPSPKGEYDPLRANILAPGRFYNKKGIKVLTGNKSRLCLDMPGDGFYMNGGSWRR